jgi:hypothetical protein
MYISTIARQTKGIRAGEVITKLAEDAYFMTVDNRVTQAPPPELANTRTMKLQVAAQWIMDTTVLEENSSRTPTIPGHQLEDLLRVVTVLATPVVVEALLVMVMPVAEAARRELLTRGWKRSRWRRRSRRSRPRRLPRHRRLTPRLRCPLQN